jgi:glutamate racemase
MSVSASVTPVIGLFDSGVGGLSVWQQVVRRLPGCPTIYLADSSHCPYGPRPVEEVRRFSLGITRFLVEIGAGLIVVACNTASAAALDALRREFDVPIVGMEPAIKPAAVRSRTGHVGVLATQGTLNGHLFRYTSARYANGVTVHVQVGEGLVERVEAGETDTQETAHLVRKHLRPMIEAGVDQIALGCTHYSFLLPLIQQQLPYGVSVIDPAAAVARRVEQMLPGAPASASVDRHPPPHHWRFFSSARPQALSGTVHKLTGWEPEVSQVEWDLAESVVYPWAGIIRSQDI